ncbi:hypothetical protein ACRAWG_26035 [Methylobacterium sp. P31]
MPDLAEVELYCLEAQGLIARAEETVHRLGRDGACEGHRLMATQGLAALRHLGRMVDRHRNRLASDAPPNAVSPPAPRKRHWWPSLRQRAGSHDRVFEARP